MPHAGGYDLRLRLYGDYSALPGRDFRPDLPAPAMPAEQNKGGLYQEEHALLLFEDAKARAVGDTITIIFESAPTRRKAPMPAPESPPALLRRRQATSSGCSGR